MDEDEVRELTQRLQIGFALLSKRLRVVSDALVATQSELEITQRSLASLKAALEWERAKRVERTMMMLAAMEYDNYYGMATMIGNHTLFNLDDDDCPLPALIPTGIADGPGHDDHDQWWEDNGPHAWSRAAPLEEIESIERIMKNLRAGLGR